MFDQGVRSYLSQPLAGHTDPLALACLEISLANEKFVTDRLNRMRLAWLLRRTDRMLQGLEELNLMDIKRVPEAWRFQLAALSADLPFEFSPAIAERPTPTEAIDTVFELQEGILLFMTGTKSDVEDLREEAS